MPITSAKSLKETKLKAGVIGLGVGEQHILGYHAAGVEVVALCDFDPLKLRSAHERFPSCRAVHSADAVLNDPDIDIVSIASYDDYHADQVLKALRNKKHVFVEKPLCMTEQELGLISSELIKNSAARLSTNTVLRMSNRFRDLRTRIFERKLGEIFYVEADYNYGRLNKIQEGWRGKIPNYSVMLGGGIHVVDLLTWLIDAPVVEVSAMGNKFCSMDSGFEGPDLAVALLKFSNGALGKVSANFGCVYPHFHKLSVYGTEATFENRVDGGFLFKSRQPSDSQIKLDSEYPGLSKADLIPSFVSSIRGEGEAVVAERDVLNTVAICLAIDKSLRSGQVEAVVRF
jgi:predicted dehydrogenase